MSELGLAGAGPGRQHGVEMGLPDPWGGYAWGSKMRSLRDVWACKGPQGDLKGPHDG